MPSVPSNPLGITVDEWKSVEGAGIRLHDTQGKLVPDDQIASFLTEATIWLQNALGIYFYEKETCPNGLLFGIVPPGEAQGDIDVVIEGRDYDVQAFADNRYMMVSLPWTPIDSVEELVLGYPENISGFEIGAERIRFRRQYNTLQVIPVLTGSTGTSLAFATGFYPLGSIPFAIQIKYRGGMSDEEVCNKYPQLRRLIKYKAGIGILNIAQNLTDPGVSSRSVSADGISQSKALTQSAVYGLYSATIDKWQKLLDKDLRAFDDFWNGVKMAVVG